MYTQIQKNIFAQFVYMQPGEFNKKLEIYSMVNG